MYFVLIIIAVIIFFFAIKWYLKTRIIKRIREGEGVFLTWTYSIEDWGILVNEFPKLKLAGGSGKVTFTDKYIYLTNYKKEVLCEVARQLKTYGVGKFLTEVRLLDIPPTKFIFFRVRTKEIGRDLETEEEVEECSIDDINIPVTVLHQAEASKILNFYQEIINKNADAVANVMPRSYGIGLSD